jgi:tetratricopeptide (TPR) repeat protein
VAASLRNLLDVLTREHKSAEADSLLGEVLTPAMENQPEGARLLRVRAGLRARAGRWKEAAGDLTKAVDLAPDHLDAYDALAVVLAQGGDLEAYRRHCGRTLARFGATKDPFVAERVARNCLLLPVPGMDLSLVEKLADLAATAGPGYGNPVAFRLVKALADYRQGRFGGAIEGLEKPGRPQQGVGPRDTQARLVLAMAKQKDRKPEEARASLTEATHGKNSQLGSDDFGSDWMDVLFVESLMREARALIEISAQTSSVVGGQ